MKLNLSILSIALLAALFFMTAPSASEAQINKAVALVKGVVSGPDGKGVADVNITVFKGSERVNTTKSTPEGKFQIVLQPNGEYRITFSNSHFYYHEEQLSVPASDKYQEIKMQVGLKELQLGRPYSFSDLIFEPKSTNISQNVMSDLENIAGAVKRNSKVTLSITVYPDEIPNGKKATIQNGIAASRKSALISFFLSKNVPTSSVSIEISNTVPMSGKFQRTITEDPAPVKGKKKKKAPAIAITKNIMVPQYAEITMQAAG